MSDEYFYPARKVGHVGTAELWIGSAADAASAPWLRQHRIGLVVNCTRHLPANAAGIRTVRVPVDDAPDECPAMLRYLPRAVRAIDAALSSGTNVLVHCHAGMSRSATVVAAYLTKRTCLPLRVVVSEIQGRKPETFPVVQGSRPNFWPALLQWQKKLPC